MTAIDHRVEDVAIAGDTVLLRGRAAFLVALILERHVAGGGLRRLLQIIGANFEQRDSALRAFEALAEVGESWRCHQIASTDGNAKAAVDEAGPSSERWISTSEASALSGYTPQRLTQLARAKALPAQRRAGRWWVDRDAVLELAERRSRAA